MYSMPGASANISQMLDTLYLGNIEFIPTPNVLDQLNVFSGRATDVNIWDRALTADEIVVLQHTCSYPPDEPRILDWKTATWAVVGNVTRSQIELRDTCADLKVREVQLVSRGLTFFEAFRSCSNLGGRMPCPGEGGFTLEVLRSLLQLESEKENVCQVVSHLPLFSSHG